MKIRYGTGKLIYLLLFFTVIIIVLAGCGKEKVEEETTKKVVDPSELITVVFDNPKNITGDNAEDTVEGFKELFEGQYEEVYASEGQVIVKLTEEQREYWKNFYKDLLKKELKSVKSSRPFCHASVNDTYDVVDFYYTLELPQSLEYEILLTSKSYCSILKVLDGLDYKNFILNIYNADTNKLVSSINPSAENLTYYTTENWEESYRLTADEAAKLVKEAGKVDKEIQVRPNLENQTGFHLIFTIKALSENYDNNKKERIYNDYKYIYTDENDVVHLGFNKKQSENMLNNISPYIGLDENVSGVDECSIYWEDDFSNIEIWLSPKLDAKGQADVVMNCEIQAMLYQLISGLPYSINIEVYDRTSKETTFIKEGEDRYYEERTGTIVGGGKSGDKITWKLGEQITINFV